MALKVKAMAQDHPTIGRHLTADTDHHTVTTDHPTDMRETDHQDMRIATASVTGLAAAIAITAARRSITMTATEKESVNVSARDSVEEEERKGTGLIGEIGIAKGRGSVSVGEVPRNNPGLRMRGSADKYYARA